MKKFNFPLAKVASWAEQQLAREQMGLARLVGELAEVEMDIANLRSQADRVKAETQSRPVITGLELEMLDQFRQKAMFDRERLQCAREGLLKRVEQQRQCVIAGHRKSKLFANLHERRRAEWAQALSKEENDTASDLFLAKIARDQHSD